MCMVYNQGYIEVRKNPDGLLGASLLMERGDLYINVSSTEKRKAKHATEMNVSKGHRSL